MIVFKNLDSLIGKIVFFLLLNNSINLFSQEDITYFLPQNEKFNDDIPTPSEILGYNIGDWHLNHDKLVDYLTKLSKSSDKIKIENRGYTYENRPLILLIITSEKNHSRLEEIRRNHLELSNKIVSENDLKKCPLLFIRVFLFMGMKQAVQMPLYY